MTSMDKIKDMGYEQEHCMEFGYFWYFSPILFIIAKKSSYYYSNITLHMGSPLT